MGGFAAVLIEVIFKRWPAEPWWPWLWLATLPLSVVINLCVYNILQRDSILGVALWFSGATALMRIAATVCFTTDRILPLTKVAYGLSLLALLLKILEKR